MKFLSDLTYNNMHYRYLWKVGKIFLLVGCTSISSLASSVALTTPAAFNTPPPAVSPTASVSASASPAASPVISVSNAPAVLKISPADYTKISNQVWKNECDRKVNDLTSWNPGEDFGSFGIGHFIWYPAGKRGPFKESFPPLIVFLKKEGAKIPKELWPIPPCPWKSRKEFMEKFHSKEMNSLREFLKDTVPLQGRFLAKRLEDSLPTMLDAAPASERKRIRENFYQVAATPAGVFALIDYVNFKGDGTLSTERYKGQGWGLLQVLEGMHQGPALKEFSESAKRVIRRRVENSSPERHEKQWQQGWLNRINAYSSF